MAVTLAARNNKTKNITYSKPTAAAPSGIGRLTRWYGFALGGLALAATGGQIALHSAQAGSAQAAHVLSAAAQQQMLGGQVCLSALSLQSAETPALRDTRAEDLKAVTAQWAAGKSALPRTGGTTASLSAADTAQTAMLGAAQSMLASLPPPGSTQKPDFYRNLTTLLQNEPGYRDSLGKATAAYDAQAGADSRTADSLGWGLLGGGLLLLGGLAAVPFQVGAVKRTVDDQREIERRVAESDRALSEADCRVQEMKKVVENLSTLDALTGLPNHRAFHDRLDHELGRALRHGNSLSLLLMDVDKFKSYNDSFGHGRGDDALVRLSQLLKDTARASDIPVRYGGKEFAIILTETDVMGANVVGERLRQAVAEADGLERPLTASIGLATLTPNMFGVAELVAQADRALCHAKGEGRNRVSHAMRLPAALEDERPAYAMA